MSIHTSGNRAGASTIAVAVLAALVSTAPPSFGASSFASLTNISLAAIDLDLNDGITAAFSFTDLSGGDDINSVSGHAQVFNFETEEHVLRQVGERGLVNPFIALSTSASALGVQASAASTATSLEVSGATTATGTRYNGSMSFFLSDFLPGGIQLTPHTRLAIAADYTLSVLANDACGTGECERAFATALIIGSNEQRDSADHEILEIEAFAQRGGGVIGNGTRSGTFELMIDNSLDSNSHVLLGFGVNLSGQGALDSPPSPPPPIPEPQTYALMLLGLGALGIASRRRNRRR